MNTNQFDSAEISMKPLKLCYNNEIHRVSKNPANYNALVESVLKAFKNDLPQNWVLQYEDSDGDKIMLTSDEDYKSMVESEAETDSKSTKIFITEMNRNPMEMSTSLLRASDLSRGQISDTYSKIIQFPQSEIKSKEEQNLKQSGEKIIPESIEQKEEEAIQEKEPEVEIEKSLQDDSEPEVQKVIHENESVKKEEKDLQQELLVENKVEPFIQETESIIMEEKNLLQELAVNRNRNEIVDNEKEAEKMIPSHEEEKEELCNPKQEVPANEERILEIQPTEIAKENLGEQIPEKLLDIVEQKSFEKILEIKEEKYPELKETIVSEEWKKSEKERLKLLMKEILMESVPEICNFMEKYLLDKYPSSFNSELRAQKQKKEEIPQPQESVISHDRVGCDSCGKRPIIGIRYKCSECENVDFCENCEKEIEHSHSLIKIKKPEQPILNVLKEEVDSNPILERAEPNENNNQEKPIPEKTEKIVRPVIEEIKSEEIKPNKPQAQMDVENKESKVDITFVKEICTVPTKVTINDKAIYKTVSLKNTGKVEWPTSSFLRNTSGVKGQDAKLVNLVPGKEFSCILILENPGLDGDFESIWRMAFYDDNKNVQFAGKPFTVQFRVQKSEISKILPKEEKNPFLPIKKEEPQKSYDKNILEKARQVKEILPDTDIDKIYDFIKKSPNSTLEQIIDQFIA